MPGTAALDGQHKFGAEDVCVSYDTTAPCTDNGLRFGGSLPWESSILDFSGMEQSQSWQVVPALSDIQQVMNEVGAENTILHVYFRQPFVLDEASGLRDAGAIVAGFGISDTALMDVLSGDFTPQGKMPFALAGTRAAVEQQYSDLPGYKETDDGELFPFGFGLTYDKEPAAPALRPGTGRALTHGWGPAPRRRGPHPTVRGPSRDPSGWSAACPVGRSAGGPPGRTGLPITYAACVTSPLAVAVIGAHGRMGQAVCDAVKGAGDLELVATLGSADSIDALAGSGATVAVEFTVPSATEENVHALIDAGLSVVVGTTGWTDESLDRVRRHLEQRNNASGRRPTTPSGSSSPRTSPSPRCLP